MELNCLPKLSPISMDGMKLSETTTKLVDQVMSSVLPSYECYERGMNLITLVQDANTGVMYSVNLRDFISSVVSKEMDLERNTG